MVSYKKMYLEMKEVAETIQSFYTKESELDFLCPLCNSVLKGSMVSIICSNPNCNYEFSTFHFFEKYALENEYPKKVF